MRAQERDPQAAGQVLALKGLFIGFALAKK